jgi:hypothetical protein
MNKALTLLMLPLLATACGGSPDGEGEGTRMEATPEEPIGTVTIVEPTDGEDVPGPDVTVRLAVTGIEIIPAGEMIEGSGHHHLLLDADLSDDRLAPVPSAPGSVVHIDDGSSEFTFENVAPGPHRIIAVVADGVHVPLYPWVVDTVTFSVR